MGRIVIKIEGSFSQKTPHQEFTAIEHGHADAVTRAIEWLAGKVLPSATAQDHRQAEQGDKPRGGWHR
jgi:hypothetical protein